MTRADRLAAVLKKVRGDAPNPKDANGQEMAPYRIVTDEPAPRPVKVWVKTADGDRIVGRGQNIEEALTNLEIKVGLKEAKPAEEAKS